MDEIEKNVKELFAKDFLFYYSLILGNNSKVDMELLMLVPYMTMISTEGYKWGSNFSFQKNTLSKEEEGMLSALRENIKILSDSYPKYREKVKMAYLFNKKKNEFVVNSLDDKDIGNSLLYKIYLDESIQEEGEKLELTIFKFVGSIGQDYIGSHSEKVYKLNENIKVENRIFDIYENLENKKNGLDILALYCVYCNINFSLYYINKIILEEHPFKLKSMYITYYYLVDMVDEINKRFNQNIIIDDTMKNREFRNALVHYGVKKSGITIEDIKEEDIMKGLTYFFFDKSYLSVKKFISAELEKVSLQLEEIIKTN